MLGGFELGVLKEGFPDPSMGGGGREGCIRMRSTWKHGLPLLGQTVSNPSPGHFPLCIVAFSSLVLVTKVAGGAPTAGMGPLLGCDGGGPSGESQSMQTKRAVFRASWGTLGRPPEPFPSKWEPTEWL